jgi:hypothetical protein
VCVSQCVYVCVCASVPRQLPLSVPVCLCACVPVCLCARAAMFHPTRGGVRGGKDQFNWDDVKNDKHRDFYLGHSLKVRRESVCVCVRVCVLTHRLSQAPVGRWQKGKDLLWYTKDEEAAAQAAADDPRARELAAIKAKEQDLMDQALYVLARTLCTHTHTRAHTP